MYVLITYKNEEDQMKNEGARVITLDSSRAANSVAGGQVWLKIKVIHA